MEILSNEEIEIMSHSKNDEFDKINDPFEYYSLVKEMIEKRKNEALKSIFEKYRYAVVNSTLFYDDVKGFNDLGEAKKCAQNLNSLGIPIVIYKED